ncbi:SPFH domain-containing protein [Kineococcus rhizosphaerae]|uniref:SPFH domain/Band 7 family protein n=1 Tax=Kineococcus rhizosphaerae TaxID=559628 RepID=A0A2T0QY19_9ACTN|nr:SPFH domain-containing protein [Kineococcus rhizosphaerae]PRY11087.1 SPFH domain/Band 7 family protein [Kineococcus rhizosphaerae]
MARHVTVRTGTRAVVTVDGLVVAVLDPGRHRLPGRRSRRAVEVVDVRENLLLITSQEAAALDVPGVRFAIAVRLRTVDPVAFGTVSQSPLDDVRLSAQVAARDWIAARTLQDVLTERAGATADLTAGVAAGVARFGVEVLEVALRDVTVPGEVRRGLLELAVARHESAARLERARGETAALRALANGTRALQDNPALLQLRTVQAAVERGGQVVLHVGEVAG